MYSRLQEAKTDYEQALRLNPKYGEALNNLATVYYAEKDYPAGGKALPSSSETDSQFGDGVQQPRNGVLRRREVQARRHCLPAAFWIDPAVFRGDPLQTIPEASSTAERARVNFCLAELYAQAGMKEQAIEYLRKALDAGFNDNRRLMQDQEFASIRQTPEFAQLMAAAK